MKPIISKADFLAKDDINYEEVDVPGWGTVRVRSLSGAGRDSYLKAIRVLDSDGTPTGKVKTEDAEARLLAVTLVDDDGKLWFDDIGEGIRILRERSSTALLKAGSAALRICGLQEEAVEVAAENLDETTSGEHGSD